MRVGAFLGLCVLMAFFVALQAAWNLPFDLPLVLLSVGAMGFPRSGGAGLGFVAGVLQGAMAGANLTGYAISRTLAGFLMSSAVGLGLQPSVPVAGLATAATTVFAQIVLLFVSPPASIPRFLGDTMVTAIVNGAIAIPLYLCLRKIVTPPAA